MHSLALDRLPQPLARPALAGRETALLRRCPHRPQAARESPAKASEPEQAAPEEDSRTYPSKDSGGFTGGWAGGEIGLRRFIQETEGRLSNGAGQKQQKQQPPPAKGSKGKAAPKGSPSPTFSEKGSPLQTGKESVGPLSGITGGFVGGERGLRQFVEKGDVKISPERQDEFSPLLVAGFVGSIVVAVALLVNQGEDAAEVQIDTKLFGRSLSSLRIENYAPVQQFVLTIALGLLGLSLTVGGARFVTRQLQSGVRGARVVGVRTLTFASFLAVVLLAAKVILDTQ